MPIRPLRGPDRRIRGYQADYSDARRGVPRVKRNFATRREAKNWLAAVRTDAHRRLVGGRERHLFGAALTRYLTDFSPAKASHEDDKSNARALRHPFRHDGRWYRLEDLCLEPAPNRAELWIVPGLAAWVQDKRQVLRRSRHNGQLWELRPGKPRPQWWLQPEGGEIRKPVTDRALAARLDASGARGPYSTGTLRARQLLVSTVLRSALRNWDWIDHDWAAKIELEDAAGARDAWLDYDQLRALLIAAAPGFDDAILGACWLGWRKANLLGLEWDRVELPVYQTGPDAAVRITHGRVWVDGGSHTSRAHRTKNRKPLVAPIGFAFEQLLRLRWHQRRGPLVFHRGDGSPWGDIRKIWAAAKRAAGIDASFRWHDLRHTWASHMIQLGASDRELQELGGWTSQAMPKRYSHLRTDHLVDAANRIGRQRG